MNAPPPPGAILDLSGRPISSNFTLVPVNFTATLSSSEITFAFRDDPNFIAIDDVSVTDLTTHSSTNLIQNGGFETGDLTGWTYDNLSGVVLHPGTVASTHNCGALSVFDGNFQFCDGAVQGYDAIEQSIPTTIGDVYQILFYEAAAGLGLPGTVDLYQQVSTNGDVTTTGGNGVDVLVYVTTPPPATPEPGSIALLGSGLLLVGARFLPRRRRS